MEFTDGFGEICLRIPLVRTGIMFSYNKFIIETTFPRKTTFLDDILPGARNK